MLLAFGAAAPASMVGADDVAADIPKMADDLAAEMQRAYGGKWGVHLDPGTGLLVISKNLVA